MWTSNSGDPFNQPSKSCTKWLLVMYRPGGGGGGGRTSPIGPPPPPQSTMHSSTRLGILEKSVSTGTTARTGVVGGVFGSRTWRRPSTSNAIGGSSSVNAVATRMFSSPVHAVRLCDGCAIGAPQHRRQRGDGKDTVQHESSWLRWRLIVPSRARISASFPCERHRKDARFPGHARASIDHCLGGFDLLATAGCLRDRRLARRAEWCAERQCADHVPQSVARHAAGFLRPPVPERLSSRLALGRGGRYGRTRAVSAHAGPRLRVRADHGDDGDGGQPRAGLSVCSRFDDRALAPAARAPARRFVGGRHQVARASIDTPTASGAPRPTV